jgi:hypothetical protein
MKNGPVKRVGPAVSADGKRRTAVLLEVLAGMRTPQQAAEVLGLSLPGFYQLEERALAQFQVGCDVRPRGRQVTGESQVAALTREVERLKQEVGRYQTLVRLTQRTVGVPPPPTPAKATGKRRKRKPSVLARRRAERLRAEANEDTGTASPGVGTE